MEFLSQQELSIGLQYIGTLGEESPLSVGVPNLSKDEVKKGGKARRRKERKKKRKRERTTTPQNRHDGREARGEPAIRWQERRCLGCLDWV